MDAQPHNLLQLMLQLSRVQSPKKILSLFLESMNAIFKEANFSFLEEEEKTELETIDIKTSTNYFGKIAMETGQYILPVSKKRQIFNAIEMLAILLENKKQQENLANEKNQLRKEFIKQQLDLHERNEQYKALAENSEDIILRFDRHYNIVYANICSEIIFEIPRILLINRNIKDVDQPEEQSEFWEKNLERVFNLGISINENLNVTKYNRKLYFNVKFVPEKSETGEVTNVFATARDITELKAKEKALFESQWHLKQAQRIAKIGSWEWNLKCDKVKLSDEMYHILGLDPAKNSLTVDDLRNFIEKKRFQSVQAIRVNVPEKIQQFEIEMNINRSDGQIRHCVICGEPILDSSGKIKKIHGTLQDITERKVMESELKNAKLKAEESDNLKSAFLANMSHEIRTPLNGILGFSELLKKKNLTADKRNFYTDIICSNGKQLLKVISDIIDISKIESKQIVIDKTDCLVNPILYELESYFHADLITKGKSNIELTLEISPLYDNLILTCDEARIKQVLFNLLANAVKFTNSGCIKFGYEVKFTSVEFYVRDTGIGIKKDFQKYVFERFRQANESESREHGGTGLGLAICKSLVELMGGKIWLNSVEDCGSEFRFSIPSEAKNQEHELSVYEYTTHDHNWPGIKILIVEDDLPSVHFLKETLCESLAEVYCADDGEKAIEMYGSINPDIILMDIRLPKINGLNVIRKIRETDKNTVIIAITANAFVEDKASCLEAGSNEYISKPVDRQQLFDKLSCYVLKSNLKKASEITTDKQS